MCTDKIKIPFYMAKQICEMEDVCYSEGQGPDNDELMLWIEFNYPTLKEEFKYLNWPSDCENDVDIVDAVGAIESVNVNMTNCIEGKKSLDVSLKIECPCCKKWISAEITQDLS